MKTALGAVGGLLLGVAFGWGLAATYSQKANHAAFVETLDAPVLELDGIKYRVGDLPLPLQSSIFEKRHEAYEASQAMLQQFALQLSLAKTKDANVRLDKLPPFEELLVLPKPTDQELKAVFESNRSRLPPDTPFDQIRAEIERFVQNQRVTEAMRTRAAELKAAGRLRLLWPEPAAPEVDLKIDQHPARGPRDAPFVLAEVSDYLCTHCQQLHAEVQQILREFGSSLRFVQINYSLRPDLLSGSLMRGAYCARQQGDDVFWRYHELAFRNAADKGWKLTDPDDRGLVEGLASEMGIDRNKFKDCLNSPDARYHVLKNIELMSAVGISGTPTFYLNNRRILHHTGELRDLIASQLAGEKAL